MGVNNGNLYDGKFYVTSSGSCTVNGTSVNIIASNSILIQGSSIAINGGHLNAQSGAIYNNYFALQNNEWIGFYNGGGISGKRKGWIGHDGGNNFHIRNTVNTSYQCGFWLEPGNSSYPTGFFTPLGNGQCTLGTQAHRWMRYYGANADNISSDRRLKDDIEYLDKATNNIYENFFNSLAPATFTMKSDPKKKIRFGFIAQDVLQAVNDIGMTIKDVDFISRGMDDSDNESEMYGLVYEEFIALNTHMIQNLYKMVNKQNKEIEKLKEEIRCLSLEEKD